MLKDCVKKELILASKSPRRSDLLKLLGLSFKVAPSNIDERNIYIPIPDQHVQTLAVKKARKVGESVDDAIIIGADTIVVINGDILGKPENETAACKMLKKLSGQSHEVFTGFALLDRPGNHIMTSYDRTLVTFRDLTDDEIDAYIKTGNAMDKAGAYGIQDESAVFVKRIEGCFYNVVGLPLSRFYSSMLEFCS
ncbi:MAG: Maf family protein [candidate division KSB1 bacterium]|nr:Maf family protein [candidate division KSB1 bacterium]